MEADIPPPSVGTPNHYKRFSEKFVIKFYDKLELDSRAGNSPPIRNGLARSL